MGGIRTLALLERGLRWSVFFTVAMLPLSEAAKNIGFGVSLALYLALLLLHDRQRPPMPLVGLALLGLLGATILSALASEYPYNAARGVWVVFRHVCFFFIALRAYRGGGEIRHFVAVIAAATGTAAVIFLYQYFVVGMPRFHFLSLGDKSASAQFLVMVLLLLLSVLAVVGLGARERWAISSTALGLVLILGLSNNQAMGLAFVLLGLLLAVWVRRWFVLSAVGALILVVAAVAVQNEAMRSRVQRLWRVQTYLELTGRPALWEKSLRIWRDHPWLGVGPRAFKVEEDVTKDPVRGRYGIEEYIGQAHNLWFHTAAEMGIVGVLAVLAWAGSVAIFLWRLRGVGGDQWFRALWVGAVGAFGAMMIAGITEPAIGYEHSLLFNAELALLVGSQTPAGSDERRGRKGLVVEPISW